MKTSRLEIRLDPELHEKLNSLASERGQAASAVVRALIFRAHREMLGEATPAKSSGRVLREDLEVVRTRLDGGCTDAEVPRTERSADEILRAAGLDPCGPHGAPLP